MGQQAEEDVLHGDILVLHGLGLLAGPLEGPVHILGDVHLAALPAGAGDFGQLIDLRPHRGFEAGDGHVHGGKKLRDKALPVPHQGQKQVGLLDLLVAVGQGGVLCPLNGSQGFLGKLIHVHDNTPFMEQPAVWL